MNEEGKYTIEGYIALIIIFVFVVIGIYHTFKSNNVDGNSFPVEDKLKIDSVSKENNKLILEVNNLDSVKDAKIIEVKELNNDSTVKLFYQLIRY